MNVAIKIKDDGGRLRAEASINAGKVFESLGKSYMRNITLKLNVKKS